MMTVFECRKCGHQLFVQEGKSFPKRLEDIAGMSCPNCGEQAEGLWGLLGRARKFRGKILCNWEETE
nr:MAG TPA: LysW biosynthesis protein LysW [Caudoviricetes sp.]